MKKIILSIAIAVGAITTNVAQEVYPCHTDEKTAEFVSSLSPQEKAQYEQDKQSYEQEIQNFISNHPEVMTNSGARAIKYTIPVVFHIIHAGGDENISNQQVEDAIRVMNLDYQKLNADANNVQPEFSSLVADIEVEFKLAKRTPSGDCTNGITRTYSDVTFGGSGQDRISVVQNEHGYWPGDEYLNVFVAADIGGAAGYTNYPYWDGMDNGIHVLHNYVGSIGTASTYTSRTMTHEVGHWFNLPHLWGSTNDPALESNCGSDDGVDDTPTTIGWTSCNLNNPNTCDDDNAYWGFDQIDNVENYMEYSYCSKMFTLGQKARMHAALENSTGGRNNLHSATNLANTGVNEPDEICKANFGASQRVVCTGSTVSFTDYSYHAPTSWSWSFEGGTPATSSQQNPSVVYDTPGTYEVALEVSDGSNSISITETSYITVLPDGSSMPYGENFEALSDLDSSRWTVSNPGENAAFILDEQIGHTGTQSARLDNFGQPSGQIDELISNPINLSVITNEVTLSFRYAYRKRSSSNEEWLRIFISNNCGDTWAQRKTIKGDNLSSSIETSSWEPELEDDWVTVHMTNVTSSFWVDNFRVKFQFESDNGNNFFLDNINVYPGSSEDENLEVENEEQLNAFSVYPNPANELVNVEFSADKTKNTQILLTNALGQNVKSTVIKAQPGKNKVMISTKELEAGVYFVKVGAENNQMIKRLIVK